MKDPRTARARQLRRQFTVAEYRLWYLLRNRSLCGYKFVRQMPIGPYIADFVCRAAALVIEVDGSQHEGLASDGRRTSFLNDSGYSVLRFWNNDVLQNRNGVFEVIRLVLEGSPPPDLRYWPAPHPALRATLSPDGERNGARGAASDEPLPPQGPATAR